MHYILLQFVVNTFVVYAAVFIHRLNIDCGINSVDRLYELASLPEERIKDTQEC